MDIKLAACVLFTGVLLTVESAGNRESNLQCYSGIEDVTLAGPCDEPINVCCVVSSLSGTV